jgi:hypothetical protein
VNSLKETAFNTDTFRRIKQTLGVSLAIAIAFPASSRADTPTATGTTAPTEKQYTASEIIGTSLFGDVYSDPSKWQDLSIGNLFSKGWDKPWASPPSGEGGAPRQGWLNAYDGVFYRLGLGIFGYSNNLNNNGNGYSGTVTLYTPLNQRFEFRSDIPVVDSNLTGTGSSYQTNFGDFQITPRVILHETTNTSHAFDLTFRTPTGNSANGNGVASVTPTYNFWTNAWKGLVVRGGGGFTIPYSGNIELTGARSTFNANLAVGYYFTPHNYAPIIGDMVWYLATNYTQAIDNRAPSSTATVSLAPGFRTHLGQDWYLLGSVDVPVTHPLPYDYKVQGALMKVW